MQYIIMADGKGTRWNNYNGTTKQSIKIVDETLLERTVRLLRKNNCYNILISSHDYRHEIFGVPRIESDHTNKLYRQYAYDHLDQETTFLYGDTFYTDESVKTIVDSEIEDVMFYGNSKAIIAIKIKDYELFKERINTYVEDGRSFYHAFDGIPYIGQEIYRFCSVGDTFFNINTPEDYHLLVRQLTDDSDDQKKLVKKIGMGFNEYSN